MKFRKKNQDRKNQVNKSRFKMTKTTKMLKMTKMLKNLRRWLEAGGFQRSDVVVDAHVAEVDRCRLAGPVHPDELEGGAREAGRAAAPQTDRLIFPPHPSAVRPTADSRSRHASFG